MKKTISVVISAFNEGEKLPRCLSSVSWADEIIVVDNSSTDNTALIARQHKAFVHKQPNRLMLNINKNYGFDKASGEWILNLDADEEVTPQLEKEIKEVIRKNVYEYDGYWISRKNLIFGKWIKHGLWWPDKQLRLFKRGRGRFSCKHIHEYIEVEGKTGNLATPFIHYNYDSVSQYLKKIDRCTTSEAMVLEETKYQLAWYDAIRFPASDFIKVYFAQTGYKDGLHGLVLSLFQAFYSFVVFAKAWEMQKFSERDVTYPYVAKEMHSIGKEVLYWDVTAELHSSTHWFKKMMLKIKRRLLS